ncbi:MAG: hypothetical protein HC774_05280 [Sphingomonadales bacterium]|nr:hypothetical protein [Sphingomonadales bacterium]
MFERTVAGVHITGGGFLDLRIEVFARFFGAVAARATVIRVSPVESDTR